MKKIVIQTLATACMLLVANAALAAEDTSSRGIKFDGSYTLQYREENGVGLDSHNFKNTFLLNFNSDIAPSVNVFGRYSYQANSQGEEWWSDYVSYGGPGGAYNGDEYNGAIDQYGVTYRGKDYTVTAGKVSFMLGGQGLLYDDTFYIGKHNVPKSLIITAKTGKTDWKAIAAQTSYQLGNSNDKIFALQGNHAINDYFSMGAVVAAAKYSAGNLGYSPAADHDKTYYAVNGAYKVNDRLNWGAEFAKSNADSLNKAYNIAANYQMDAKNSLWASWWRVEQNAAINNANWGSMTGFWADAHGTSIVWSHKMNKDVSMNIGNHNFKYMGNSGPTKGTDYRNSFRTVVSVKF